jgi:hypothetical protein
MPSSQKTFRVFVSSTFTDFRAERRILQKDIFPRLKALCESKGASFQDVDLRWGVNEDAQLDQKTMDICLNEIHRCQKLSPKPNFIILLGDRYGWQPVPGKIPSSEMIEILIRLSDNEKIFVNDWYKEDTNAVPPEYVLQSRGEEYTDYGKWQVVEDRLRETLRKAVGETNFTEKQREKYFTSATHQEIMRGALNPPEGAIDPKEHVFAYMREIRDLPENIEAKNYIDLSGDSRDKYAKDQLERLRTELKKKLPDKHIYEYEAEWNKECKIDDIEAFGKQVYSDLETIIKAQFEEMTVYEPAVKEIKLHEEFKRQRLQHFTGRDEALEAIRDYLQGNSSKVFSIIGASGSGKTSIIAKAIEELKENTPLTPLDRVEDRGDLSNKEEFPGVSIFRFIGTTSNTSDAFKLLTQIIRQITEQYGVEMNSLLKEGEDEKKFATLYGLRELYSRCLSLASREKPLIIFLDALDLLSTDLSTLSLDWLPKELPENVRMIVSALPELKGKLSHTELFELKEMSENDGEELLTKWLDSINRTLQDHQRDEVINKFKANGTPLYLRLAFEKAKEWRSYTTTPNVLMPDIEGMLGDYFEDLQRNHGKLLMEKFCGYVLSGKYQGLTENELLDLFVFDKKYWNYLVAQCHPDHQEEVKEIGKLPVVVWSRLFLDMEPYLTEKDADGIPIISFYHRKFIEYVRGRYLDIQKIPPHPPLSKGGLEEDSVDIPLCKRGDRGDFAIKFHSTLADYFEKEPLYLDDKEKTPNVRKVVEQPFQETFIVGKWKDLVYKSLGNFSFLMAKAKANMVEEILEDYVFLRDKISESIMNKLYLWQSFFKERVYILRRGNSEWPAYKILLQLAVEHSDDSPVTLGAEQWLQAGHCDWPWLRRNQRQPHVAKKTCLGAVAKYPILRFLHKYILDFIRFFVQRIFKNSISQQRRLVVFEGHLYDGNDDILNVFETKDGRFLSWANDQTLRIWDRGGNTICILDGHRGSVEGVLETKDGRFLSWSYDHTLRLWDESGKPLVVFKGHTGGIGNALETKDGRFLSKSLDNTLRLWNDSGISLAVFRGHTGAIIGVFETKDGRFLSWGFDSRFLLWDREGRLLSVLEGHKLSSPNSFGLREGMVTDAFETKQGHFLSWSTFGGRDLHIWSNEGKLLYVLEGHTSSISGALETKDGSFLSWANDKTLRLWDKHGTLLCVLEGHTESVEGALETKDGRFLSWSNDKTLRLWDKHGTLLCVLEGHTSSISGALETKDGSFLSWAGDQCPRIWYRDGKLRAVFKGYPVYNVFETRDGNFLSTLRGNTFLLWSIEDTSRIAFKGHTGSVSNILETKDGNYFSWANDISPLLWGRYGKLLRAFEGHTGTVKGAFRTKDGRFLSWSEDNTIRLWSSNGMPLAVLKGHTEWVSGALETKDGCFLSWGSDNFLLLWDESGTLITVLKDHRKWVKGENGCFVHILETKDGRFLSRALAPHLINNNILLLWTRDGNSPYVFEGHTGWVRGVLKTKDGRFLSWADDHTLRLWDRDGKSLCVLEGHTWSIQGALETKDGCFLSWAHDDTLRLWDASGGPLTVFKVKGKGWVKDVLETKDGQFLSRDIWDSTLWLWNRDGRSIGSYTLEEGLREFPEFRIAYCGKQNNVLQSYFRGFEKSGCLTTCNDIKTDNLFWQGDSTCTARHLKPNGLAVLSQNNGQVCFLRIYYGNNPISVEELENFCKVSV